MSNNLDLSQVAAAQDQKEDTINDQAAELDAALTEPLVSDYTSGDITLTDDEFRRNFEFATSNLTVPRILTIPAIRRFFLVDNTAGTGVLSVVRGATSIDVNVASNGLFYADGTTDGLIQAAGGAGAGGGGGSVDFKDSVRVATIIDGTFATAYEDGDTIDGVALVTGDRILLKDQTTGSENGIYTVEATGAPTRATDFDGSDDNVTSGAKMYVEEGTVNTEKTYVLTNTGTITINSTALVFELDSRASPAFIIAGSFGGTPGAGVIILSLVFPNQVVFPSGLTESQGAAGTGPSVQTDFDIQQNTVSVGTMRFAMSATTATFIMASETTFTAGQILDVVSPGALNGIADIRTSLAGFQI